MKTYRIAWSRLDFEENREDYFHVVVPARNKVMALASVRKYFAQERECYSSRYAHSVVSLEVLIGKGNRRSSYWRALSHKNIYVSDYRLQSLALDIADIIFQGLPNYVL